MSQDSTTSLTTPTDAYTRLLGASCLDFLLIELVPMAERLAREREPSKAEVEENGHGQGQEHGQPDDDDEARRESTFFRLEGLGYRVGQGLAERYATRPIPYQSSQASSKIMYS